MYCQVKADADQTEVQEQAVLQEAWQAKTAVEGGKMMQRQVNAIDVNECSATIPLYWPLASRRGAS